MLSIFEKKKVFETDISSGTQLWTTKCYFAEVLYPFKASAECLNSQ